MYVRTQFIKNDNPRHLHECDTNFVIEGNWMRLYIKIFRDDFVQLYNQL